MAPKPRLFVGSSVEGLSIAYAIQDNLKHTAEITVWPQGVFELSKTTIESLIHIVNSFDFGLFVFSADDAAKMRGKSKLVVRDNVLFELGLFIGKLGRDRVFIVIPEENDKLHIPTDLLGVTPGKFENKRSDDNLHAGTASFCNQVRLAINSLGRTKDNASIETLSESSDNTKSTIASINDSEEKVDWNTLYGQRKYPEAISLLEEMLIAEKNDKKKRTLNTGLIQCKLRDNPTTGLLYVDDYIKNGELTAYQTSSNALINEGYLDRAGKILDKAFLAFPDDSALTIIRARILSAKGLDSKAISLLQSVKEPNEEISLKLCALLVDNKQQQIALQTIHKAFLANPNSEKIQNSFASLALELDRYTLAYYLYDVLFFQYPKNQSYSVLAANAAMQLKLYDTAISAYRKAIEITEGKEEWIFSNLGNVLKAVGAYEDAKGNFHKSIEILSENSYAHNRLGEILKAQEEEAVKSKDFLKAGQFIAFSDSIAPIVVDDDDNDLPF